MAPVRAPVMVFEEALMMAWQFGKAPEVALVMTGLWMWMAPVRALVMTVPVGALVMAVPLNSLVMMAVPLNALVMAVPVNAGLWRASSLLSIGFCCCCCYCWGMWLSLLLFFGPIGVLPKAAGVWVWVLMGFDAVVIRSHVVLLTVV